MLCTIWKDFVRVCIVLKTRIGRVQYLSILYITLYNNLLVFIRINGVKTGTLNR